MTPKDWGLWITIGTLAASGIAKGVGVEQKLDGAVTTIAAQERHFEKTDDRVSTLERDSTLLVRLTALEGHVAAMAEQVRMLREELARERRKNR